MTSRFDSLHVEPMKEFCAIEQFYSRLKDTIISEEEYHAVKKFYLALKLEKLVELNKHYNLRHIIILREVFESRAAHLNKIFKFNLRNAILTVPLADAFIEMKVNTLFRFQLIQKKLNFLKEHL